jgi:hypothetical protein
MASGLEKVSDRQDEDEISRVEVVEIDKVHDMIMRGEIRDGKTVIGISLFRAKLDAGEIPQDYFR